MSCVTWQQVLTDGDYSLCYGGVTCGYRAILKGFYGKHTRVIVYIDTKDGWRWGGGGGGDINCEGGRVGDRDRASNRKCGWDVGRLIYIMMERNHE